MATKNRVSNRRTMQSPSRSQISNEHEDRRHFNPGRPHAPRRSNGTFAPTTNRSSSTNANKNRLKSQSHFDEDQDLNTRNTQSIKSSPARLNTDRRQLNPGKPNAPHRPNGSFAPTTSKSAQHPPREKRYASTSEEQHEYDTQQDYDEEESDDEQEEHDYKDDETY